MSVDGLDKIYLPLASSFDLHAHRAFHLEREDGSRLFDVAKFQMLYATASSMSLPLRPIFIHHSLVIIRHTLWHQARAEFEFHSRPTFYLTSRRASIMMRDGIFSSGDKHDRVAQKMLQSCNASRRWDKIWFRFQIDMQNVVDYFSDTAQHRDTLL